MKPIHPLHGLVAAAHSPFHEDGSLNLAVVEKQAVPKERVRLGKDTVQEEQQVSDTVRKEQIDVDDAGRGSR